MKYLLNPYSQVFIKKSGEYTFHKAPDKTYQNIQLSILPTESQKEVIQKLIKNISINDEELNEAFSENEVIFLIKEEIIIHEDKTFTSIYERSIAYYTRYIDKELQTQLSKKSVLILGCGGIGSHMGWHLASWGIGTITLLDFDCIEESNFNRQILYDQNDIGKPKSDMLREHLLKINPYISIESLNVKVESYKQLKDVCLSKKFDLIIKAVDSPAEFPIWLDKVCKEFKIPYVTGITTRDRTLIGPSYMPDLSTYTWSDIFEFDTTNEKRVFGTLPSIGIMLTHIADELAIESFKILTGSRNLKYLDLVESENLYFGQKETIISKKEKFINKPNNLIYQLLIIIILTQSYFANSISVLINILVIAILPQIEYKKTEDILKATFVDSSFFCISCVLKMLFKKSIIFSNLNSFMIIAGGFVLGSAFSLIMVFINFLISKILHRKSKIKL